MLDKLPPEVILTISGHLNFKNKLNLIATCRRLYNLISKTSLFTELDLLEHKEKAEDIIQLFKDNQPSGSQVKLLWVDMERLPDQVLFELSTIFPHVTRLTIRKVLHAYGLEFLMKKQYANGPMLKWSNTLDTFNLSHDWPYILHAMKDTTFPRLTELGLGYYYDFKDKKDGFDFAYFIPYIKNAPSLKKLTLFRYAVNLDFLEQVHSSCPYIKTLILNHTQIVIRDHALPQPITSANSLLHLEIKQTNIFDKHGLFLDYIVGKYTRLKFLQLGFTSYYDTSEFGIFYEKIDIFDYMASDQESDDGVDEGLKDGIVIEIYESLESDLESTFQVYRLSGSKFFAHLPKTIKTLFIPYDLFNNLMEVLAKSGIQPTMLACMGGTEGGVLRDPEQFQYIKDITSLKSLEIGLNLSKQVYDRVFPSTSITKLSIIGYGDPFYIDWLLSMFPLLEELCIIGGQNITVRNNGDISAKSTVPCYPKLLLLVVRNGSIDQSFIDFFKAAAPNINTLSLAATVRSLSKKEDLHLDISGWNLRLLNIALSSGSSKQSHFYNIKSDSIAKTIRYNPIDQTVTLIKDDQEMDTTDKQGDVDVMCVTHQHFMFHGFAVYLMHDKLVVAY